MASEVSHLSISVLGLGSIGLRHARNLTGLGASVSGFDPDQSRRDLLVQAGGNALLARSDVFRADAIVIASPSDCHLVDLQETIAAGRHVFIEKPLSHTDEGLGELLRVAEQKGLVVFAGLNLRFHAVVRRILEIIAAGSLGRLLWSRIIASAYLPSWRPHQDHRQGYTADPRTGGAIFDNIHEIDLAYCLFGPGRTAGAAAINSGTLGIEAEDVATLLIQHERGLFSEIHLDYATRPARREIEIAGTEGQIRGDLFSRQLTILDKDGAVVANETLPGSFAEDYVEEMRAFLSCIAGHAKPPCDGRQALEVLRLALSARQFCGLPSS